MSRLLRFPKRSTPLVLAALLGLLAVPGLARAQAGGSSFEAVAAADGIRVGVAVRNFLLVEQLVDVGAPSAQAVLSSIASRAFAAYPYPGDVATSNPNFPAPLIATSSWPTQPEDSTDAGLYSLTAKSDLSSSSATAAAGVAGTDASLGVTRSAATARLDPATGTLTAEGESALEALRFTTALRIGRVESRARVVTDASGRPQRHSELHVGEIAVGGQRVGLSEKGLVLAGTTVPIPRDHPLAQTLEQHGLSVRYLAGFDDRDGVVAPGIEVSWTREIEGVGIAVVSYTLGRASAHASARSFGGLTFPGEIPSAATSAPPPPPPAAETAPVAPTQVLGSGLQQAPAPAAPAPAVPPAPIAQARPVSQASAESFYLVLVVAGLAALGGGQLVRIFGVRLAWKSPEG